METVNQSVLDNSINKIYDAQKKQNLSTRSLQYRKNQIQNISHWIDKSGLGVKINLGYYLLSI